MRKRQIASPYETYEVARRTFPNTIVGAAQRFGSRNYLTAPGGQLTFSELPDLVARGASGLRRLGVNAGENVAIFLTNRVEFPVAWWAPSWISATAVLIHSANRGAFLARAVDFCDARVLICDVELLPEVQAVADQIPQVNAVVVVGAAEVEQRPGIAWLTWGELLNAPLIEPAPVRPTDPATIIYTSGTTGRPKAVTRSHHMDFVYGANAIEAEDQDETSHLWSCLPATHVTTAHSVVYSGLLAGSRVTLVPRFSARAFWKDVAACGATHVSAMGPMANVLAKQASSPYERTHSVKLFACIPPPVSPADFESRFGVRLLSQGYGMTEVYAIHYDAHDWSRPFNFLGRPRNSVEIRVADASGYAVPKDGRSVGEILVRPNEPGYLMSGYYKDPEATVEAWRDLWFHTGDLASVDSEGYLYYQGRTTDSIRRRGENISAAELEQAVLSHPLVSEAAAYGVPSELGEEDVKVDVVWVDGAEAADARPENLVDFLVPRVPFFMVPRYIQTRPDLPKTPSQKVQKYVLKAEGIGPGVFDREAGRRAR